MNASEPNDRLDPVLVHWRVTPLRDPEFRSRVWARIESAKLPASWPRFARLHPAAIVGIFSVAVVLGAVTGRERAKSRAVEDSDRLAASYVHGLDARSMTLP
jgi:hypothetical protein